MAEGLQVMKLLLSVIAFGVLFGQRADEGGQSTLFPYTQGWLGADAAYSLPLDRFSTLWLFGDTFVGKVRSAAPMIHNSIAIRRCQDGCTVTYWWSGMRTPRPAPFFKTRESDYYWPLDGFVSQNKLYVFLEQMHATGQGGAFGFDYSRVVIATISNFLAAPDHWQISYRTISIGNQVVPGIATAIQAEYLYVFTLFRRSTTEPFGGLLRVPVADLLSNSRKTGAASDAPREEQRSYFLESRRVSAPFALVTPHWQYLARGSKWLDWSPGSSPADAVNLLNGNITEMTVSFHPARHKWVAVFPTPQFFSKTASYSTAAEVTGPWTEARPLFTYPEMQKTDPRFTPHVFCYAAKEHPELESRNQIAFTYACNSTKEPEIFQDMRLYSPQLVVKAMPGH